MTGDRRQAEHVGDEVAIALTLTCRAADKLVDLAAGVTRLPAVLAALAAGRVDLPRAGVYARELAALADVPAAAIAAVTVGDAASMTTGELGSLLRRLVLAHDPDAARRRRAKAERDARVQSWAEPGGTWALAGRDLPPADVLAADRNIDAQARALKKAGAGGTLEFLRAAVFTALLSGRPLWTLLPGTQDPGARDRGGTADGGTGGNPDETAGNNNDGPGRPGSGQPGDGEDGPGSDDDGNGGGNRRPGPRPGSGPASPGAPGSGAPGSGRGYPGGLNGSVNLTLPLTTWLGLASQPGEAPGYGPLDPGTSRDLATRIAATPASQWCATITAPDGTAIGHGCAPPRAGPPPAPPEPPPAGPPGEPGPPGSTSPPGRTSPPGSTGPPGRRQQPARPAAPGRPANQARPGPGSGGGSPGSRSTGWKPAPAATPGRPPATSPPPCSAS